MTREEAVERISDHMEVHKIGEYPHIKLAVALNMAIDALRAQRAKLDSSGWEGCKECTPLSCGTCVRYNHRNTGDPCTTSCIKHSKHKPVNFCKNCGRPLTEEGLAELERKMNNGTTD